MFLRRLNLEENYKYNVLWIKSQIKYLRFQLKVYATRFILFDRKYSAKNYFPRIRRKRILFEEKGAGFPPNFVSRKEHRGL